MNKLKPNQIGPWCTFCEPKTIRAVYVQRGWYGKFACEKHETNLADCEKEDNRRTEADHQTWERL